MGIIAVLMALPFSASGSTPANHSAQKRTWKISTARPPASPSGNRACSARADAGDEPILCIQHGLLNIPSN